MHRYFVLLPLFFTFQAMGAELQSQASILPPGTLELRNDRYFTSLSDSATGMPALGLGFGLPFFTVGGIIATAQIGVGYRYKQGSYTIESSEAVRTIQTVSLHWIPFSLATKLTYDFPGFTFFRPTLTLGLGAQWLRLVGSLPEYDASFWAPYAFISPALTVWEARDAEDWFGGFSFGTTFYRSFATPQRIDGLSLDLTLNILL